MLERVYGPDHVALATLCHNLGGLEHARGQHARGEPWARRAVLLREAALGPDHPVVAEDVAALAAILDGLGQRDEAEALYWRAIRTFELRLSGGRSPAAAAGSWAATWQSRRLTQRSSLTRWKSFDLLPALSLSRLGGLGDFPDVVVCCP